jgi:hypothetical protein
MGPEKKGLGGHRWSSDSGYFWILVTFFWGFFGIFFGDFWSANVEGAMK